MALEYKSDGKAVVVPKVIKPTSEDFPWGGGYIDHPILSNPWWDL